MRARSLKFLRAGDGAVLLEFTLIVSLLMVFTCGMVDFSFALYQWNAAAKATALGARLAAVSDPVAGPNTTPSYFSTLPPTTAFTIVCSDGSCSGGGTYDPTAMNTIVYGRGKTACGTVTTGQLAGMCDVYPGVNIGKVKVTYQQSAYAVSGLGYASRSGGPVPTITVELTGVTFNLVFLNTLLGLAPIAMPPMRTTITGEDLSSSGS